MRALGLWVGGSGKDGRRAMDDRMTEDGGFVERDMSFILFEGGVVVS